MTPDRFRARVDAIVTQSTRAPAPTLTRDPINRRLIIAFQVMPDKPTCAMMRKHGFKFRGGPVQAWVRPITHTAVAAASAIMAMLGKTGE